MVRCSCRPAALLALALAVGACQGGERAGGRRFFSIGTAGTGGVYYPLGGAIAARLSLADPDRQYTAEVTGGSVENVNRVAKGEMDLGFSMAPTVYEAFNGGVNYPRPRAICGSRPRSEPNVTRLLLRGGLATPWCGSAPASVFRCPCPSS
ncbi:hypothetical protein HRbin33_01386 [bacterium HR33]|nr:hypothetical protein HRbin33_01386 [bacterium HR33]